MPTLQIDSSDERLTGTAYPNYPNVFALGDVADTGAHKAARPGHFQSGVVTRNIQRLIKADLDLTRRSADAKANGNAEGVEQITEGISKLRKTELESYTAPDVIGIHLRLGMVSFSSWMFSTAK